MSSLQENIFKRIEDEIFKGIGGAYTNVIYGGKGIYQMIMDGEDKTYHYAKRKHGKWTIYDKDGWQIAGRLNEREMKNYMKLLLEN